MEAILKREVSINATLSRIFGVAVFVILTALGAFVRIPLPGTPVPFTLQTLFVLLAGACLGNRLGGLSQLSYIALGACGLPIFTNAGTGLLYLYGPTAGYLVGFVVASFLVGNIIRFCRRSFFAVVAVFILADTLLFACGVAWLKLLFGYSLSQLLFVGVIPFVPGEAIKIILASVVYLRLQRRIPVCP